MMVVIDLYKNDITSIIIFELNMLWNKNCTHRILLKFEHRRHYNFVNASFFGFKKEEQQHLMIHVDIKQKGFF